MRILWFRLNFGRPKLFRAAPTQYCEICMECVLLTSCFKATARCKHSFCSPCMSSHITSSIGDGVVNVRCPALNCQARLDPLWCRELLSSKSFLRWCELLFESCVVGFPKCYCPNSNCREIIVDECGRSGKAKRFDCPICRRSGCFQCGSAWVEGHRCSRTLDEGLILLEHLADWKKWGRCPTCHMYVERRGGCNTIHCRCGTLFCYVCRQDRHRFSCSCTQEADWIPFGSRQPQR
ncbi:hypothetical protein BT93_L2266 [Corymbia citriodora subsp. variegata]|uniref:Uncharacterized protein n=1 Tax=Corymbia citriodora subsp. variegata TaxID=360336 RepID=A0A8T0CKH5_CORYI|nr:hypothetical protein BT93_L2266 [Corymbia citriodora subsp. variegata]